MRLVVPRLSGHSGQDADLQERGEIAAEKGVIRSDGFTRNWSRPWFHPRIRIELSQARRRSPQRSLRWTGQRPDPKRVRRYLFSETGADGAIDLQQQGGIRCDRSFRRGQ